MKQTGRHDTLFVWTLTKQTISQNGNIVRFILGFAMRRCSGVKTALSMLDGGKTDKLPHRQRRNPESMFSGVGASLYFIGRFPREVDH